MSPAEPPVPIRWSSEELERQRQIALGHFIRQRTAANATEYQRLYEQWYPKVIELFQQTEDLARFTPSTVDRKDLLDTARLLAMPPWSRDDLTTVSGVALRKRLSGEQVEALIRVLETGWDPVRFPWLADRRRPTVAEREAAIRWTAGIAALERLRTERRMEGSRRQQKAVQDLLAASEYTKNTDLQVVRAVHHLPIDQFTGEVRLKGKKTDAAVRLSDDRLLSIECKVSSSTLNSIKRLIRDSGGAADYWRGQFGQAVIPAVVLSGVYKLSTLIEAQDTHGLAIFWDHDLEPLRILIEGARAVRLGREIPLPKQRAAEPAPEPSDVPRRATRRRRSPGRR